MNLVIPYPTTTGNHVWKHTTKGKHYITAKGRDYFADVKMAVMQQGGHIACDQPIVVQCLLYPPDKRRRDMDNAWKVIGDALTKANVWVDDALIRRLLIEWMDPVKGGKVVVSIAPRVENVLTS